MSWQRPNIGSRVTREGHARFWERLEVKFLRATQQQHALTGAVLRFHYAPISGPFDGGRCVKSGRAGHGGAPFLTSPRRTLKTVGGGSAAGPSHSRTSHDVRLESAFGGIVLQKSPNRCCGIGI